MMVLMMSLLVELHLFAPPLKLGLLRQIPKFWLLFKYYCIVEVLDCICAELLHTLF